MSKENPGWGAPRIPSELPVLYMFLVLAHERRRISPPGHGTSDCRVGCATDARSISVGDRALHLLRDRDKIFGHDFVEQGKAMGISLVLSAHTLTLAARMSND